MSVRKIPRALIKRSLASIRHLWSWLAHHRLRQNVILIYSMGKVGSSTIHTSLKRELPTVDIFHVHFLSNFWLETKLPLLPKHYHVNIGVGKRVLSALRQRSKKRLKVITLVREPIIREISNVFQNWDGMFQSDERIDNQYLNDWMDKETHEYALTWFDSEFAAFLNIDIYSYDFDKERGYSIYNLPHADVLCIKLEKLSDVATEAFRDFLGLKNFKLITANKSSNKKTYESYKTLKLSYVPTVEKLNKLYSSRYMRHFYSKEEIDSFIVNWRGSTSV